MDIHVARKCLATICLAAADDDEDDDLSEIHCYNLLMYNNKIKAFYIFELRAAATAAAAQANENSVIGINIGEISGLTHTLILSHLS